MPFYDTIEITLHFLLSEIKLIQHCAIHALVSMLSAWSRDHFTPVSKLLSILLLIDHLHTKLLSTTHKAGCCWWA